MQLGMIGLGRMGANMSLRLLRKDHELFVYDRDMAPAKALEPAGAKAAATMEELVEALDRPRNIWVMVPSGPPVAAVVAALGEILDEGDCVIDGGNSNYHETVARGEMLAARGIHFLDCGTSGGIWGLENGYCLMVGGEKDVFARVEPIFESLAPPAGYGHMGPSGTGHYVKMIHNGIEYGMMQAYAEGFEILDASEYELDLHEVAALWQHGSVVRSWLLELAEIALADDPKLASIRDYVGDSGEGRWTVQEAIDRDVPAMVLTQALYARFRSRQQESFGAKLLAALREGFGGHRVEPK
ncbi:MAG TPA: decarboxylating 6-phosphogluconate dehydrogenase [Dehalococcoidia bacterium]|nr:decarboxylating 6-phosphogluconate dehydrogenase [Dehalococcoidia bacterium]